MVCYIEHIYILLESVLFSAQFAIRFSLVSRAKNSLVREEVKMMSSTSRAIVAATIGVVEAMKDQMGICRWDYIFRSAQQNTRNPLRSLSQAKSLSSSTSAVVSSKVREEQMKKSEESLRKVMYLSCWGPY
ncbi:uncharacterized protein LOC122305762 [Carya illinoinensis]|nr:uncharacterized protein LOC122305762 [Carya illinoinensis]